MSFFNDEESFMELKAFVDKYRYKMGEGKRIGNMDWETFRKLDEYLPTLSEMYSYARIFKNVFGLEFSYDENRSQTCLRGIDRVLWGIGFGTCAMESLKKSLGEFLKKRIMMDCFDKTEWWELLCGYSIQTLPPEGTLFFPYGTDNKRCSIVNGKSGIVAPTYMVSDERRKLYLQGMWKFEEKIDESP